MGLEENIRPGCNMHYNVKIQIYMSEHTATLKINQVIKLGFLGLK